MTNTNSKGFRYENKYLIGYESYLQLRNMLKKFMQKDENSQEERGYHVRSLYFDDIYDTALVEKNMGILKRKKYRIRIYNFSSSSIKLEEKIKNHDYIKKKSSSISIEEYEKIYDADVDFLLNGQDKVRCDYYIEIKNKFLRPKVIVDYFREAYILPFNQIRVTFDIDLSAAKARKNIFDNKLLGYKVYRKNEVILEVKYNNFLPSHIRSILEICASNKIAISKYVICRNYIENRF